MNIAILGCGYIGSAIAALWKKKGHVITATTRTPEKLEALTKVAQKSVLFKGTDEEQLVSMIAGNDVIVFAIAADSVEDYEYAYLDSAKNFRHLALGMDLPKQLIYVGSTSIYGDHHGQFVDETSPLLAKTDGAKILIETEKTFQSLQEVGWEVCLFRFAEIYGPEREISERIKMSKGHPLAGTGEQYTNMVHKADCIAAIDFAMRHHLEGVYNLADDDHPTRRELYDQIALKYSLPKVQWNPLHPPLHAGNKRVSNHKIKTEGFAFLHPKRVLD